MKTLVNKFNETFVKRKCKQVTTNVQNYSIETIHLYDALVWDLLKTKTFNYGRIDNQNYLKLENARHPLCVCCKSFSNQLSLLQTRLAFGLNHEYIVIDQTLYYSHILALIIKKWICTYLLSLFRTHLFFLFTVIIQ